MSFFSELRSYFDTQVAAVDSTLSLFDDAFGEEDINNVQASKSYKLIFGDTEPVLENGNYFTETMPATLIIYAIRTRNEIGSFDPLYQKARDIKALIMNPVNVATLTCNNAIFFDSIVPGKEETDDKTYKMTLNFTIRTDLDL
jgi:hypothetical protein